MGTVYAKPPVRSHVWAETATNSDIQDPGDTFVSAGWPIGQKPPRQYFNWVLNYTFESVRYFCQAGVPAWDAAETYSANSLTRSPNGYLVRSLVNSNVGNNPDSTFGTQWGAPATLTLPANDNSGNIPTTAWVKGGFLPVGSTFASISGTIANGQVPLSAVQQWQGSLSISFSQLVGTVFNSQIPLGAVSQWQANLLIGWGQITGTKNADQLQGLVPNVSAVGNAIMVRDGSGYAYATYFNQSSGNSEDPAISQFMITNGADNFLRKASKNWVGSQLNPTAFTTPGYTRLPGGLLLQWGIVSGSWPGTSYDIAVSFPQTFTGVFFAGAHSYRSNAAFGRAADGSGFVYSIGTTGMIITIDSPTGYWFAIGY